MADQNVSMIWPPSPGLTSDTIDIARRATWTPLDGDGEYGRLGGLVLTAVQGDARDSVRWHAAKELPERCGPRLISRAAFEALRAGELAKDGTIVHEGRSFRLADVYTAHGQAAELLPVDG